MMPNAFANLNNPAAAGQQFQSAFDQGRARADAERERQRQAEVRTALGTIAGNPDDQAAFATVFAENPRLGMKIADYRDGRAFNNALADYIVPQLGGGTNALLAAGGPQPSVQQPTQSQGQPNGLATVQQGASFEQAFTPMSAQPPQNGPEAPAPPQQAAPDMSHLGEPRSAQDRAFLEMVQRDPVRALEIRSDLRDNFVDQVKAEHDFYALAIDELSRANDAANYQASLQRLAPRAQAIGGDLFAHVPREYPGPEGIQQLLEKAIPIKDRLGLWMREANIEADNERADINTDSLIETREGRLTEYRRANRAREGNQRRGQNMADRRQRDRPTRRRGRGSAGGDIPTISTPAEAAALPSGTRFKTPDGTEKIVP